MKNSAETLTPDLAIDLGDRLLWVDGTISVTPENLRSALLKVPLSKLNVTEVTPEISTFNRIAEHPLKVKTQIDFDKFPPKWTLPEYYANLDLDEYLLKLADRIEQDDLYEKRLERLAHEIALYKRLKLDDILKALIYVVETLQAKNAVWGVGRGSSCSSYLLYLMGLHEVDAVLYEIDVEDFLKPS